MEKEKKQVADQEKYDDRTKQLMDLRAESERQFDKQIIYLSGGALIFSIGFVKDIIGANKTAECKFILVISWICFAVSLIVNIFSYLSSKKAIDSDIIGEESKSQSYNFVTKTLNLIALGSLLVGLVLLILFASINF